MAHGDDILVANHINSGIESWTIYPRLAVAVTLPNHASAVIGDVILISPSVIRALSSCSLWRSQHVANVRSKAEAFDSPILLVIAFL